MKIRCASLEDLESIHAIEQRSFKHPWTKNQLAYEIGNEPISQVYILVDDGIVLGYIFIHDTTQEVQILNIAVDQDYRKSGYGKHLMNYVLKNISKNANIFLEVRASNFNAIQLYIATGFKEIGRRQAYYQGGEDAIVMKLKRNI